MKTRTYLHTFATAVFCARTGRIALLALAFGLLLCSHPIPARAWPGDLFLAWSSPETDTTRSVAWGDWDGDGDLDLAVGNDGQNRVYENEGWTLALEPAWSSTETDDTHSVAWGDWDDDGDLDLAVGNWGHDGQPNRVYRNTGGALELAWSSLVSDTTTSVAWGDWDGDGDLDLAVGNRGYYSSSLNQPNRVYRNEGGTLMLAWASPEAEWDATFSVAWGDWDGDGDLDLAVGNQGRNRIYRNYSVETPGTPDTDRLSSVWSSGETNETHSVAWGDWDSDGDLDLAVGNSMKPNRVYHNHSVETPGTPDPDRLSLAWSSVEEDMTRSVAWGDWDDDGDLDLAVGNGGNPGQPNRIYRNAGGTLVLAWSSTEEDTTLSVAWEDWDGDGDLDLAVGNYYDQPNRVYRNAGGWLAPVWSSAETDQTTSVAWGDWDGDGDLDLAVGNEGQPNRVYRNVGGSLAPAWSSIEADWTTSVAWGDWDGDGDLDLAVGNSDQNRVYRNDSGMPGISDENRLALAWTSLESEYTTSVAWGDWNGDGDLDLAVGNWGDFLSLDNQPNRVYRNDSGMPGVSDENRLAPAWSSPESEYTTSVAWGDWDGDGDLDLAVGNSGQNWVYRNDSGMPGVSDENRLAPAWSSPEMDDTHSVAWGDWDGDGDLDLAVGNSNQNRVYRNEGGSLAPAWSSDETDRTTSVAWGDWDGDGDLDLAVGNNGQNWVYRNDSDMPGVSDENRLAPAWTSPESEYTTSVAWGDWDGDGDLDLAAGNDNQPDQPNRVYRNVGGSLTPAWSSPEMDDTHSAAWGDWDGDGDLDLAVGNAGQNWVYRNDSGMPGVSDENRLALAWTSPESEYTTSVAWGDWDGDGDLDLAVGNGGQPSRVYSNTGASLALAWSSPMTDTTHSVAWGDWDGDGDLDLVVGNDGQPNRVYENEGGTLALVWSSAKTDNTTGVAWGDWDGDGDLDLAVGNDGQPDRVYSNTGGALALVWSSAKTDNTTGVAWGDWDGDGDLDLAVGNDGQPNRVYLNGGGTLTPAWSSPEWDATTSVAWGDWDGDGDLDLAVGNGGQPNRVYRNEGGSLTLAWSSTETDNTTGVIWGDWDDDGDLDLAVGNWGGPNWVYNGRAADMPPLPDTPTRGRIAYPGPAAAPFFASATVLEGPTLPISYTLFDPEGDPARFVRVYYSIDGGGDWRPAVAASGTITTDLAASPTGAVHVYTWDIWGSGILGATQGTLFRLDVYQGFTGPGPYQRPFRIAQTLPFRVRGSQVRVLSGTVPAEGAAVYRLPAGHSGVYQPYRDGLGLPRRTTSDGYLQGRGEIGLGDRLVALAPFTATDSYVLYYTNASPISTTLKAYTVDALGVQTLVVSPTHPLLLFDLDVSLEWDARNDDLFMAQLEYDLQRASVLLYDWTDGQAALGNITIYHDRAHWDEADVRIYATNRMRPNAAQGGISADVISDTDVLTLTYGPGQVHMGAVWNRYGEPGGGIGEDWPRTLAHELGHYALFLDDNYLGLDESGLVIPVAGCTGAMSDPYREDYPYDEFHAADGWLPACEQTLSHQATGRSDWQTIEAFYPWLSGPPDDAGAGPSALPLAVTQIEMMEPVTPATTLADPTFYLIDEGGSQVQPGASARAFLFQGDRLTDLGRPTLDRVLARGARVGDRLCVYELAAGRLGCEEIAAGDEQLALVAVAGWQPNLVISPVTSRTIGITVTNVELGLTAQARLYPLSGPATDAITLTETGGEYVGVFTAAEPALVGYVHVRVVSPLTPLREVVADYALGGNPGRMRGGCMGLQRNRQAPAMSADGQVILFGDLEFDEGEFFALQGAPVVEGVPAWMSVVGQAYRLVGSADAPDLSGASISFAYLGSEVPSGQEGWIKVYHQAPLSGTWQVLPTQLDAYHNTASAPVQGQGLYVLMTSVEIPIYASGWNLIAYPVLGARPVVTALASISGTYGVVYGYEATDVADPWKVYAVGVPAWVNDLEELEFGHGYWISVTEPITLHLRGAANEASPADGGGSLSAPPATYYGTVKPGEGFAPAAGMEVSAWIGGRQCGQGILNDLAGDGVVYTVNVMADDAGAWVGCGAPGREVVFRVDGQEMTPTAAWSNDRVWELTLQPLAWHRMYLPLVARVGRW